MAQLPPIYDNIVMDNNSMDGRPKFSPSHWNENFTIHYLTEKMRSMKDPEFSNICDRVAVGRVNEEDIKFFKSRVKETNSEKDNENFKNGSILYIVTTNKKRNHINNKKLLELLPNEKEYVCYSVDNVKNLPASKDLPTKINENPGRTGNLMKQLRIKVGSPVVITSNHSKKKYREDGYMNGARGFIQSVTVSNDDPDNVEIIWVVFHDNSIGHRYRFDHRHLLKKFNPGHEFATPILPQRKSFTIKLGNVEYQRSNFPLALAYAITAHKCQGETLDEVIIDFRPDKENNIKNYITDGSFYVALTRVKEGSKVYLKNFDLSYIKVNPTIEEKISAMRKFRPYLFKKIYLDENIFNDSGKERKIGYLNINGLMEAGHAEYLDADKNLQHLDILVIAETKLNEEIRTELIKKQLPNWSVLERYDSDEGKKNMGILM